MLFRSFINISISTHITILVTFNINIFCLKLYNKNKFKIGFIDCSHVTIYNNYNLDYIVSLDKGFKVFEEIKLFNLK